jgi:hypothetical protein
VWRRGLQLECPCFSSHCLRAFPPLETAAVASWAPTRFASGEPYATGARLATDGGSKIRLTRRLPHRGHIIRSRNRRAAYFVRESRQASQGSTRPDGDTLRSSGIADDAFQTARMDAPAGGKRLHHRPPAFYKPGTLVGRDDRRRAMRQYRLAQVRTRRPDRRTSFAASLANRAPTICRR